METEAEKFEKLLEKSKKILIITPPRPSDDIITSAIGIYHFTKKLQKSPTLFLDGVIPTRLSFLSPPPISSSIHSARDFVLVFNTQKNKIIDIKTDQTENQLTIRLTTQKGFINPKDFSFSPSKFKYDLIFLVGVPALEKLGKYYYDNTDLFFEVPKINLDHHSSNNNYGQVNLTEATASSTTEILADVILEKYEKIIDPSLAQTLLAESLPPRKVSSLLSPLLRQWQLPLA